MSTEFSIRSDDMPPEMGELLTLYPRDGWEAHPGFRDRTRHWLGAHQMFRRLANIVRTDCERFLDGARAPEDFAPRLHHFGGALVGNLKGHHGWEDYEFFPELSAADPRFDRGLEILEKDHEALDEVLERFTDVALAAIRQTQGDAEGVRASVGRLHGTAEVIEAFLNRHLGDEEDLAVPIILHHRLRG